MMTPFNIVLHCTPLMASNGRRRRPTGSHRHSKGGVLLVLLLLILQQVSGSRSPDSCNYNSRSQEDSELLGSFSKILEQLQPLENLFDIVCAGDNAAWATVQEELVAVSHLSRSLKERLPHKAKGDEKQAGRQSIIQGSPIQVGASSNVKPKPVNVGNLTPFGASIGIGSNKPINKVSTLTCQSLTPKINVKYISIVRSNGLLLNVRAGIDGCKETIEKELDTGLPCQCGTPFTSQPTVTISTVTEGTTISGMSTTTTEMTVINGTTGTGITITPFTPTPFNGTTTTEITPVTITTATEGTTGTGITITPFKPTPVNGTTTTTTAITPITFTTTTEGTTGTDITITSFKPTPVNGTTTTKITPVSFTTTTEGTTGTGITVTPFEPTSFNGTTSTELTPVTFITTTSGTIGTGITTAPTEETEFNGTTTTPESKPAKGSTTTTTEGTTGTGVTTVLTKETEISGTTTSKPDTSTTTTTEGTTDTGVTTAPTKETEISGTTSKLATGTTITTEGTTMNGTTTTSTGSTSNETCVTASANITAEITKLNEHMNDIQNKIQGVTQALIECAMDKNALEKAKVLTQTLRELVQRLQGILDRLSTLQGQPQARLIPAFLRNFNVPSLRGVYVGEEEVHCPTDRTSFPESFAAIDMALGSLAEHPTNSTVADRLYCSASHMVDTTSQIMQGPQVRQGSIFEETNHATTTNAHIDHVLKAVAEEEEENENLRKSLEIELIDLKAQSKDIEGKLIEAKKDLQQQDSVN